MCFKKGKVIIISAPSGSGKTTITRLLLSQNLNLHFSVSACSREKRPNELDGVDYHFIGLNKFKILNNFTQKKVVALGGITKKNIKLALENLWSCRIFFLCHFTHRKIVVSNCISIFFHQRLLLHNPLVLYVVKHVNQV